MKKVVYIVVILSILVFCSCGNREEDNVSAFDHDIYERPAIGNYSEESQVFNNTTVLLKDYNSYREYVEKLSEIGADEDFHKELDSYKEEFFEEEMLIVLVHWEPTGASKLSLDDIVYENANIEVVLKSVYPEVVTDDSKDYGIIIRIPRDDKYSTIEYRVIKEYEKKWYEF